MLVSKDWLQTYFDQKLPEAQRIADVLNFHAFEIEEIKAWDTDEILDVKVLADRACYALCHRGIAEEISASANMKLKRNIIEIVSEKIKEQPEIDIKKSDICSRYIGRRVEDVEIKKSPDWLKWRLESIGERSINNVVDVANFVMFEIGQPLHAFDADKIKGAIKVRLAKIGENIVTLDNHEVELDSSVLVIADDEGPLAIAGIKGGKRAEVTENTKNLILESANFDRSSIRLTSTKLGLKTNAAKRFEANLSPELAFEAMEKFSSLIAQIAPKAKFGPINDIYKNKQKPVEISITSEFISEVLGISISEKDVIETLAKLKIFSKKKDKTLVVFPPLLRTDLNVKEDIVEEVGRIFGYENIVSKLPESIRGKAMMNKNYYYTEKIKNLLRDQGFNEVYLYSFTNKGILEVAYPLADDKGFLRENLSNGINECLKSNIQNASLLGISEIRIFEVGSVFGKAGERLHVCIGRQSLVKKDRSNESLLQEILTLLSTAFKITLPAKIVSGPFGAVAELDLTDVFSEMRSPNSYNDLSFEKIIDNKFKQFSQYPFVLRDIAVFVPKGIEKREPIEIIKKEGGEWLQRIDLFDIFEKKTPDGNEKTSYAFHMVFQSMEKTLNDVEVNKIMDNITQKMNSNIGWQVR